MLYTWVTNTYNTHKNNNNHIRICIHLNTNKYLAADRQFHIHKQQWKVILICFYFFFYIRTQTQWANSTEFLIRCFPDSNIMLCVLVYLQQEELQEQNNNKNLGASDYGRANESMYSINIYFRTYIYFGGMMVETRHSEGR